MRRFTICAVVSLAGAVMSMVPAYADDYSALYGTWWGTHTACGKASDDFWDIKRGSASQMEETCKVSSATRNGKTYKLTRQCVGFADETWTSTDTIRLISKKEIEVGGQRYRRC